MRKQYQVIVWEIMNLIIILFNVVYIAKTTPSDYRNGSGRNERGRDDHAPVNIANDHITDNGSKSTYKVFCRRMIAGAILVGIIGIACFYGPGFLYQGTCVSSYYFLLIVT